LIYRLTARIIQAIVGQESAVGECARPRTDGSPSRAVSIAAVVQLLFMPPVVAQVVRLGDEVRRRRRGNSWKRPAAEA